MSGNTPLNGQKITPALSAALTSPSSKRQLGMGGPEGMSSDKPIAKIEDVASDYLIQALSQLSSSASMVSKLLDELSYLLTRLRQDVSTWEGLSTTQRRKKLLLFLKSCLRTKVSIASY
jgi:hypothetical protein